MKYKDLNVNNLQNKTPDELRMLLEQLIKDYQQTIVELEETEKKRKGQKVKRKKLKKKLNSYSRASDTVYRVLYPSMMDHTTIADNKANFLIALYSIMISGIAILSVTQFSFISYEMLAQYQAALWLFVGFGFFSFYYALRCIKPRIYSVSGFRYVWYLLKVALSTILSVFGINWAAKAKKSEGEEINLLYFNSLIGVQREEYGDQMLDLLRDKEQTYLLLAHNIYDLSCVISKKYRDLNLAFGFLGLAFVISLISIVLISLL